MIESSDVNWARGNRWVKSNHYKFIKLNLKQQNFYLYGDSWLKTPNRVDDQLTRRSSIIAIKLDLYISESSITDCWNRVKVKKLKGLKMKSVLGKKRIKPYSFTSRFTIFISREQKSGKNTWTQYS